MNEFGKNVKLIVSEIDGILTNGWAAEDEIGNVIYKLYNLKEFSAINELKKHYIFVFLSDDNRINYNLCKRRNIPFYWGRNEKDKFVKLGEIFRRYSVTPDQTLYVASKISDRKCIQTVPKSLCPADAGEYLKRLCFAEFIAKGGEGILVELLYLLKYCDEYGKNLE